MLPLNQMGLPAIETTRLTLRPWSLDDIDAMHRVWTDPQVRRFLWDDEVISRQRAATTVESAVATASQTGIGFWCVLLKPNNPLAGFCGFRLIEGTADFELLYGLLPEFWGRGLASEACYAALDYAFKNGGLTRVYARADTPNQASVRVMERLGMRFERETRLASLPTLIYSVTAQDLLVP